MRVTLLILLPLVVFALLRMWVHRDDWVPQELSVHNERSAQKVSELWC